MIHEARTSLGMTQQQLAESLSVSKSAVSKWERGLSFPDISILEALSERLNLDILELIKGERIEKNKDTFTVVEVKEYVTDTITMQREVRLVQLDVLKRIYLSTGIMGLTAIMIVSLFQGWQCTFIIGRMFLNFKLLGLTFSEPVAFLYTLVCIVLITRGAWNSLIAMSLRKKSQKNNR